MLEFRRNAEAVIKKSRAGVRMVLTYRGKPVMRLEPVAEAVDPSDPFYRLDEMAADGAGGLSNQEIDRIVYGE